MKISQKEKGNGYMLIRFVVENIFSFGETKEFNMIPRPRLRTYSNHKYSIDNFELLKISSIYGANGAGKSNLVNSLNIFQDIVINETVPLSLEDKKFKFKDQKEKSTQIFAIEFVQDKEAFYYGLEISNGLILTEELYKSGLGKKNDELIFERKTNIDDKTTIKFSNEFENDEKSQILKAILMEEFVKPNKTILKLISNRDNKFLRSSKKAYNWFEDNLQIITPESKPRALAHWIDKNKEFKKYAENIMCSFDLGIKSLKSEIKDIYEVFGDNNKEQLNEILTELDESPQKMIGLRSKSGDELIVIKENDKVVIKQLKLEHKGIGDDSAIFDLNEESDGTIRLLDFIPAFQDITSKEKVYIIDEIERSIHPLLIKELINKFTSDEKSKGQLIFTTHESNLLDQNIFRQDEIWFAEKNSAGATDLYSLSDFKEHNTIDIRKGYLNGRYGSIPFLANLKDLNWHRYDIN